VVSSLDLVPSRAWIRGGGAIHPCLPGATHVNQKSRWGKTPQVLVFFSLFLWATPWGSPIMKRWPFLNHSGKLGTSPAPSCKRPRPDERMDQGDSNDVWSLGIGGVRSSPWHDLLLNCAKFQ